MAEKEYIEREAAIDACFYGWNNNAHDCAENIRSIPAADVRPVVRGRWEWDVLDGTPGYRPVVLCCSNCHMVSFSGWDFCPSCGADMRPTSMSGANEEES